MNNVDVVVAVSDLRHLDDSEFPHMKAALVEGFSWFLLDRNAEGEDDGKSQTRTSSGRGLWTIMTPKTAGFVGLILSDSREEEWIRHPHIEEPTLMEDVELAVLVEPEESLRSTDKSSQMTDDSQQTNEENSEESDPLSFELDDFLASDERLDPEPEDAPPTDPDPA